MGCDACNGVGILTSRNLEQQNFPQPKKNKKVIYNMGNNEFTDDRDKAAGILLQKHFPNIHQLLDINESDYKCGIVGVCRIPALNLSEIPKIAEPKNYRSVAKSKGGAIIGIER